MFAKVAVAAAIGVFALSAYAEAPSTWTRSVNLKDGSTLYIFADGKMGMENRFGSAVDMRQGEVMHAKDGTQIAMNGNEVARTDYFLKYGPHRGSPAGR